MWKSVAMIVYTQYATGQPISNLASVLNRLSQQGGSGRRSRGLLEARRIHEQPTARELLQSVSSSNVSQLSGVDGSPPIVFSAGVLSVITLIAEQDLQAAPSSLSSGGGGYLPTSVKDAATAAMASIASIAAACGADEDLDTLTQSTIVAQTFLSDQLNGVANQRVSPAQFELLASSEAISSLVSATQLPSKAILGGAPAPGTAGPATSLPVLQASGGGGSSGGQTAQSSRSAAGGLGSTALYATIAGIGVVVLASAAALAAVLMMRRRRRLAVEGKLQQDSDEHSATPAGGGRSLPPPTLEELDSLPPHLRMVLEATTTIPSVAASPSGTPRRHHGSPSMYQNPLFNVSERLSSANSLESILSPRPSARLEQDEVEVQREDPSPSPGLEEDVAPRRQREAVLEPGTAAFLWGARIE